MSPIEKLKSQDAVLPPDARDPHRAALELLELAAAIVTRQGAIEFANAAWRKTMDAGFPSAGAGESLTDVLRAAAERQRERSYAMLADAIGGVLTGERNAAKLELRVQVSGERRWYQAVVKSCGDACLVTLDDQTTARATYSSMVDVTRVLRTVLDNTPHCTFWLDKLGCIEGANQAFFGDTGLGGIIGKTVGEIEWQGLLATHFRQTILRVAADGRKARSVVEVPGPEGTSPSWIDASVEPLVSGDGTVLGFVCAYIDVSDIKAQEKLLHLTQSSIDQAKQPLLWIDTGGAVAYVNEAAAGLSGYDDRELRAAGFFRLQDQIEPQAWRAHWDAPGAKAWTIEFDLIAKSGARIPVEVMCSPIEHGGDKYISVYIRDLREKKAAEEANRQSELRYRLIVDSSLDAVITTETGGRILQWSRQAERIFGIPASRAIGEQIVSLIFPDTSETAHVGAAKRLMTFGAGDEGRSRFEVTVVRADGVRLPAEMTISKFVESGVPMQTLFVRDLSEQAALKQSVRIAEERLSITLESAGVGTFDWDVAAGRLSNDERCATMLFYEPGDIDKKVEAWLALIHPDDLAAGVQAVQAHFKGETDRYFYQKRMRAKDRSWRWLHETGRVVERDANGNPLRVLGIVVDVTDMKRAQDDLRGLARRLSLAKDTARIGIWEFDYQTRVATWDDRMFELYGATRHTLNPLEWDQLLHPDDREQVVREIVEHERENRPFSADYRIVKRDGSVAHIQARGYLEFDANGKLIRELGIVQDVTDEVRRRRATEQAEKLQAVGTLAAGVAHEFNNILSIISGFADMARTALRRGDATPDQLDPVIEAAARGAKLTKGMLAFSRKSTTRDNASFDLRDLASEQKLFLKPLVGPAYDLIIECSDDPATLCVEREGVAQCLMNLVANARDAMPHGGEIAIAVDVVGAEDVKTRLGAPPRTGEFVRLAVSDAGLGMDAATVQRIFEPFFTTKDVGKGTGLGLAYIYGFVKEVAGHLDVQSAPGAGTTFFLYFPLARPVQAVPKEDGGITAAFAGKTVLLIDDEPGLVQIYKSMLEELGCTVLATTDTDEGLNLADDHPGQIDFILSDVLMPKMRGPRFVALVQALHPETQAIFMTGQPQRGPQDKADLPDGVPVLSKPFAVKDLAGAMMAALEGRKAA